MKEDKYFTRMFKHKKETNKNKMTCCPIYLEDTNTRRDDLIRWDLK